MADPHFNNRMTQMGNICIQWSALEYHTAVAIWNLVGILDMEVGKVLTANLDLNQRIGMAFTLAHITNAPMHFKIAIKALQTALQDEDLIHRRNQAVHGIHFRAEPGSVEIEMHRGKGGRAPRIQRDIDLSQLGRRLNELDNTFVAALKRYMTERWPGAEQLEAFKELAAILKNNSDTNSRGDEMGPA